MSIELDTRSNDHGQLRAVPGAEPHTDAAAEDAAHGRIVDCGPIFDCVTCKAGWACGYHGWSRLVN